MPFNILIVDGDIAQGKILGETLRCMRHNVTPAQSLPEAIDIITGQNGGEIDLLLLDVTLPGVADADAICAIKQKQPYLPVVMTTNNDNTALAVQAVKAGAVDYIVKNHAADRLKISIENAIEMSALRREISRLKRSVGGQVLFTDILGSSGAINHAVAIAKRAAASSIPVFIEGEKGAGKELFARAIHGSGPRAAMPFIVVDCSRIPENTAESLLFGHERGALANAGPGAAYKRLGKFREAEGGTIFLSEVGELKSEIQAKLLHVLEDGEVLAAGGKTPVKIDVRVISATSRNLEGLAEAKKFREDLYYRLKVFPLSIPPLRDRREDIGQLADYFCRKFLSLEAKKNSGIADAATAALENHNWRGNVGELQDAAFCAVMVCDREYLDVCDFPMLNKSLSAAPMQNNTMTHAMRVRNPSPPAEAQPGHSSFFETTGNFRRMAEIEADVIKSALEYYQWRISEVARRLGIGRSTLYRKMDELHINIPRERHQVA